MTNISGHCKKNKSKIAYLDCQYALKHVVHDTDHPVPIPPSSDAMNNEENYNKNDSDAGVVEYTYDPNSDIKKPHLISQDELHELVGPEMRKLIRDPFFRLELTEQE